MSWYTSSWPAFTIAMSSPAAIAWYRNAECIARRTASFPRNEKLRLDTPPDTFAPGQCRLISRVDSMNALAYSLCSSIPVATARMFGSMMMSSGANPASSTSSRNDRSAIATLRSTVSAWPVSSKHITTAAAP